ncbi:uncharacterized protein AB9X84_014824 isoform 1-T1 [Acanthopagrus schlegelii]
MWQEIKTLTGYKDSYTATSSTDRMLPHSLNYFFSRLDCWIATDTHLVLPGKVSAIQLDQPQVRSILHRVDVRKAAGPDGVAARMLKACADQPAEVFTTIFNLSLVQSAVLTCLKSATIIPAPKEAAAHEGNVALCR